MKTILFALLLAVTLSSSFAQIDETMKGKGFVKVKYYQDFLNFQSSKVGNTRLDVFIEVPYNEIQFVKKDNIFESKYTATISIFAEDKEKLIQEKTWDEVVDVNQFPHTTSPSNFNISIKSFDIPAGKYFIRTSIEDQDSKKTFTSNNMFTIRDLQSMPNISDIMFIAKQTKVSGTNKILPNVTREIAVQKDGLPLFFEIYSNTSQNIILDFDVTEGQKKLVFRDSVSRHIDSGKTQAFYTLKINGLGLGNYLVAVTLKDSTNKLITTTIKSFSSRWVGVPSAINDLDKAIAQLVYIATSSEKSYISSAPTKEEKIARYLEFWKKKNPNPNEEQNRVFDEYYRRINFANENFTTYNIEGWRTDRGMVYITLGPPNNIDRHPFEVDSKPYETWEYYDLNQQFVFMDETGFGDYRLLTPMYGDMFRYRY
jgi:GWxTD domain-containing protein